MVVKHASFTFQDDIFQCSNLLFISDKGLDPLMLFRIIETLQLAHDAGQILVTDFICFLLTLISRFRLLPGSLISKTCCVACSNSYDTQPPQ